jgi:acyl carrier protein
MTEPEIRATILRLLGEIAPEAEAEDLRPDVPLRDQLDLDSMDFLNLIIALNKELKVEVPESDYPKLATLDGCVSYLTAA